MELHTGSNIVLTEVAKHISKAGELKLDSEEMETHWASGKRKSGNCLANLHQTLGPSMAVHIYTYT